MCAATQTGSAAEIARLWVVAYARDAVMSLASGMAARPWTAVCTLEAQSGHCHACPSLEASTLVQAHKNVGRLCCLRLRSTDLGGV